MPDENVVVIVEQNDINVMVETTVVEVFVDTTAQDQVEVTLDASESVVLLLHEQGPPGPPGEPGPAGPPGDVTTATDKTFVHTQNVASTTWEITHNLGKRPSVFTEESTGDEIEGAITHLDANRVRIEFSAACSGVAYLN